MKKKFINAIWMICVIIVIIIVISKINYNKNKLSKIIIKQIDNELDGSDTCTISMKDVTEFKWDKMLIYQVGSANKEISDLLGVKFKDDLDLASGLIFVYKNKIIYKEQMYYDPEKPYKLFLDVGVMFRRPKYGVFTPDDAIFAGSREEYKGELYYTITPMKYLSK